MTFKEILKTLFHYPAPIVFVAGRMGMGKTDYSLLIAEKLLEMGIVNRVATNISVENINFTHITSLSSLKTWLDTGRKDKKLFILDEAGLSIDARNPLSTMNKQFRHIAYLLRKYRGHMIIVAQRPEDVESTLRELTLATFRKLSLKTAIVESDLFPEGIMIQNIPKTSIPYNTYDIAPFELTAEISPDLSPCCQMASLYIKHDGNLTKAGKERGLHPQQVKRLLIEHVKHTLHTFTGIAEENKDKIKVTKSEENMEIVQYKHTV